MLLLRPTSGSLGTVANGDSAHFDLHTGFMGIAGTGQVRFKVYKTGNPTNFMTITYKYHSISMAGIFESNASNDLLSQNYPNPFTGSTAIKYDLGNSDGKLLITDVQGKAIAEYKLDSFTNEIIIGDLEPGIYFYSLYRNEAIVSTRKMIVQ